MIIEISNGYGSGQLILQKSILIKYEIISNNNSEGKRGTKVYSPWDEVESTQTIKSQKW